MKGIFWAALLLNLIFLAWAMTRPPPRSGPPLPPLAAGIERLQRADLPVPDTAQPRSRVAAETAGQQAAPPPAPATPLRQAPPCLVVGPMEQASEAETLAGRLREALGANVTVRRTRVEVNQYWVYLPPVGNASQARELARELGRQGLSDYQVLASPGKRNAISLGLYSDRTLALKRMEQIRALGYEPLMETLSRKALRYQLQIKPATGQWVQPGQVRKLLGEGNYGLQRAECEDTPGG